jgi:hypothetical protein
MTATCPAKSPHSREPMPEHDDLWDFGGSMIFPQSLDRDDTNGERGSHETGVVE